MSLKVYLAPMEGLADPPLRKVLCACGGYDWCFSEFIKTSTAVISPKTLARRVPELDHGGCTPDGTPCRVQLLGDNPAILAQSALVVQKQGALGLDLNFGCPSRFVHHSGSMLLREPALLREIVDRVSDVLNDQILFSIKIRSGFADKRELCGIIEAIARPRVNEICVHCRTRRDLYKKEALDWSVLSGLTTLAPGITFVANGDITSRELALECAHESGCSTLMVGRGAFMVPNLGKVIKGEEQPCGMAEILNVAGRVMDEFCARGLSQKIVLDRSKQFLSYARRSGGPLPGLFREFCHCTDLKSARMILKRGLSGEFDHQEHPQVPTCIS